MVVMWLLMPLVALCAAFWWWQSERARWHRLWLDEMHGARSDTLGVGLSILVAGECSLRRYEALLGVEYARLEVVAVVDGSRHQPLFEELILRYHLIRVGYRPSGEFSVRGVQGLYRSRRRRYRRFVLLDCRAPGVDAALDAAADVAAYEYLLPLRGSELPAKGVIEELVTEVALRPMDSVDQICLAPRFAPSCGDERPWRVLAASGAVADGWSGLNIGSCGGRIRCVEGTGRSGLRCWLTDFC